MSSDKLKDSKNKQNNKNNDKKQGYSQKNDSKGRTDQNKNIKKDTKDKFVDASTTYEDIIDVLSVSPSASDPNSITWQDQFSDYIILLLKYLFLVGLLMLNFLGLSVSLNCNADQELGTRIFSAIFAFFFGFVYLLINYYTYKVMSQGKMCKMNREKLFPFKV
jgi:hypothetical protein